MVGEVYVPTSFMVGEVYDCTSCMVGEVCVRTSSMVGEVYVCASCMVSEMYVHTSWWWVRFISPPSCMLGEVCVHTFWWWVMCMSTLPAWWLRFTSKLEMKTNIFYLIQGNDTLLTDELSWRRSSPGVMRHWVAGRTEGSVGKTTI